MSKTIYIYIYIYIYGKAVSFVLLLHLKFGLKLLSAYKATRLHEIKSWRYSPSVLGSPAPRPTNEYSAEARKQAGTGGHLFSCPRCEYSAEARKRAGTGGHLFSCPHCSFLPEQNFRPSPPNVTSRQNKVSFSS
jgi:hypothetical protein